MLSIVPDAVTGASGNLDTLGSSLRAANAAAASQTTAIAAPAADDVSAAASALFSAHAQEFQAVSAKAAAFHDQFVSLLNGGAAQYLSAEATNAQQTLATTVNAPAQALLGGAVPGAAIGQPTTGPGFGGTWNLGPLSISLSQTGGPVGLDGYAGVANAAVTLNTPLGPLSLLTANGTQLIYGSGPFALTLNETTPLYTVAESVSGIFPAGGAGFPAITAFSFYFDGLGFSI